MRLWPGLQARQLLTSTMEDRVDTEGELGAILAASAQKGPRMSCIVDTACRMTLVVVGQFNEHSL